MNQTTRSSLWLPSRSSNLRASTILLCFPYAGGSETIFSQWQEGLPDAIEVCPVQLPGRGARVKEPPSTDLRLLVEAAAEGLIRELDKPFALFGHSLGGAIAFELARHFRREYGVQPSHLFISARCSPRSLIGKRIHRFPAARFEAGLGHGGGTAREVLADPELMEIVLPLLRADLALGQPGVLEAEPPLDCPITVFGGLSDRTTTRECLEGWRE